MIVFEGIGKRFPGAGGPALDGIDLEVPDGSVLGLVGRNGAGKTTLLRIAAGILRPTSGHVRVDGLDLRSRKADASRTIGWVPEVPRFDPEETPAGLLEHLGELDGRPRARAHERGKEMLDRVGLSPLAARPIRTLSQGELRRLALASAWLADPAHFLYDEVTNGLDAPGRALWERSVEGVRDRGGSVILASHQIEEIEAWSDRIALLETGRLVAVLPGRSSAASIPRSIRAILDHPGEDRLALLRQRGVLTVGGQTVELRVEAPPDRDVAGELAREGFRIRSIRSIRADLSPYLDPEA